MPHSERQYSSAMPPPTTAAVAAAVRAEMARAGISRRALARALGVDKAWLDRRLSPHADAPPSFTVEQLHSIAKQLDVPFAYLAESGTTPAVASAAAVRS